MYVYIHVYIYIFAIEFHNIREENMAQQQSNSIRPVFVLPSKYC